MKTPICTAIVLALALLPSATSAQVQQWTPESPGWTPELRDVWEAEKACITLAVGATEERMDCLDPDYFGWGVEWPIPGHWDRAQEAQWRATHTVIWSDATPLHVLLQGDLAVVQVAVSQEYTTPDGSTEVSRVAWTDILKRSGGKWRWISDHGHDLAQ